MKEVKKIINLFYIFSILGIQMFGNLATMIPIFERELIEKRKLITKNDLLDSISLGRCGPGAAIINTVVFLGNSIYGVVGGIIAVLGFILFPFIIIMFIAIFMNYFENEIILNNFFIGGLCCISIMIVESMIKFGKSTLVNKMTITIFLCTLVIGIFVDIPVFVYIILAGIIGLIYNNKGSILPIRYFFKNHTNKL